MLLTNYDFYDLHALIVFFRSFPEKCVLYTDALKDIIRYIDNPLTSNSLQHNIIRKKIRPYIRPEDTMEWVYADNIYTANISVIKNQGFYTVLSLILKEFSDCCENTERLYLLADCTHNIPLLLAHYEIKYKGKIKQAIKTDLKPYRTHYNKEFLQIDKLNIT